MTAAEFAILLRARLSGPGRWQARCPAHTDHSPSLTIREGREGRTLLHCFAGCEVSKILAALGLGVRDLFSGELPTPQQAAALAHQRAASLAVEREQAIAERRLGDIVRRLNFAVNAIGYKLARIPEGDQPDRTNRLTELFHTALVWLTIAEEGVA